MQEARLAYLFNRYFDKTATHAERDEFLAFVDQEEVEAEIQKLMEESYQSFQPEREPFAAGGREKMLKAIVKGQKETDEVAPLKRRRLWPLIASAAAILLVAGVSVYFYTTSSLSDNRLPMVAKHDIKPGKNTATLTLADGRKIILSDAANGELAKEGGVSIQKTKDGKVIYAVDAKVAGTANPEAALRLNTISTAAGQQYQVILPDGTLVWLNALSSLKYPSMFTGHERKVELEGEGYFEVTKVKDRKMPFIVLSNKQRVEVLGTHFNINSYANENATKTTLLEGSVSVSTSNTLAVLKPGQQAILMNGKTRVVQVQTEDVVAWKNGYFMFNNESLEDVMRKVARWYDVQIEYKKISNRKITFFGTVSRFSNISQVLRTLEHTEEVKFEIEGRRVIVIEK
uniref:FecR family protein n=1 Tax=Pedobacter schmidteae TaxID=2201271 RepID=UPI000EB23289|nr:FecR family protein [Pedobacter schmidteae]